MSKAQNAGWVNSVKALQRREMPFDRHPRVIRRIRIYPQMTQIYAD
jgi:hypothetical protein